VKKLKIREFLLTDIEAVKKFTDQVVGQGYYSIEELAENQKKSITKNNEICSFVLIDSLSQEIKGLRLAFPPGKWKRGKGSKLSAALWPTKISATAYFQSLFISPELQGQEWGPKLSSKSLQIFKKSKFAGVVTHCWKESPNNSSYKYLASIGFKIITEHPNYWIDIDYTCTRDGKPCKCTAIEMHLSIEPSKY